MIKATRDDFQEAGINGETLRSLLFFDAHEFKQFYQQFIPLPSISSTFYERIFVQNFGAKKFQTQTTAL
jgi:hypothetical protein